jgi:hypothetical protein
VLVPFLRKVERFGKPVYRRFFGGSPTHKSGPARVFLGERPGAGREVMRDFLDNRLTTA